MSQARSSLPPAFRARSMEASHHASGRTRIALLFLLPCLVFAMSLFRRLHGRTVSRWLLLFLAPSMRCLRQCVTACIKNANEGILRTEET